MAFRTWGRLLLTALAVSMLAGAGQLGIAYGFGIVRLTGAFTDVNRWPAQLAWVGWFAVTAAVAGAVVTGRLARREGLPDGTGVQLAISGAAALGAVVVAPLCMQPARAAELSTIDPVWAVGICAVVGAAVGAAAASAVLLRPPLGWNVAMLAGAMWLIALVSTAPALLSTGQLRTVRLGVLEPTWLDADAAQRLAMLVLPALALLAGAVTGGLARWRGHVPLVAGAAGAAGPVLLAFAYLTAGPGDSVDRYQLAPYYGAVIAVAAGALGSAAATLLRWPLRPGRADDDAIAPTDILAPLPAGPDVPTPAATQSGTTVDLTGSVPGAVAARSGAPTPAHWDWPATPGTPAPAPGPAFAASRGGTEAVDARPPTDPTDSLPAEAFPPFPPSAPDTEGPSRSGPVDDDVPARPRRGAAVEWPPATGPLVTSPPTAPTGTPQPRGHRAGTPTERPAAPGSLPGATAAGPVPAAATADRPAPDATTPAPTGPPATPVAADTSGATAPTTPDRDAPVTTVARAAVPGPAAPSTAAASRGMPPATSPREGTVPARTDLGLSPAAGTSDAAVPAGRAPEVTTRTPGVAATAATRPGPTPVPAIRPDPTPVPATADVAAPTAGAPEPVVEGVATTGGPESAPVTATEAPATAAKPRPKRTRKPRSAAPTDPAGTTGAPAQTPPAAATPEAASAARATTRPAGTATPEAGSAARPTTAAAGTSTGTGSDPVSSPAPADAPSVVAGGTAEPVPSPLFFPGPSRADAAVPADRPRKAAPTTGGNATGTPDNTAPAIEPARPRHRAPLPDLGNAGSWNAFGAAPAAGSDLPFPNSEQEPVRTPVSIRWDEPAPTGAGQQVDPAQPAVDAANGSPDDTGPASGKSRGRRSLFRRKGNRAGEPVTEAPAGPEPLAEQDEEFVDWVTGLSRPLADNEPETESGRRSLRSSGRHHRD